MSSRGFPKAESYEVVMGRKGVIEDTAIRFDEPFKRRRNYEEAVKCYRARVKHLRERDRKPGERVDLVMWTVARLPIVLKMASLNGAGVLRVTEYDLEGDDGV